MREQTAYQKMFHIALNEPGALMTFDELWLDKRADTASDLCDLLLCDDEFMEETEFRETPTAYVFSLKSRTRP